MMDTILLLPRYSTAPANRTRTEWSMSRAFVKEQDGADVPEDLPERPVSPHPNFVTARGLRLIEAQVRELEQAREQARRGEDKSLLAHVERDLRYWQQRKAGARLTEPEPPAVKGALRHACHAGCWTTAASGSSCW